MSPNNNLNMFVRLLFMNIYKMLSKSKVNDADVSLIAVRHI